MQFLRTNTAVIVTVGPFLDKTDGVTLKTALTITNEKITLTADTDAGSAPTNILDNVTGATSGTANDLNYITGNDAAMMQIELAAADVNRLGRMTLIITDAANHCPVFHDYMVLPAVVYDSLVLGTDRLQIDVREMQNDIITDAVIATDAEVNVANAVWDALTASHVTAGTFGLAAGSSGSSAAVVADAVWDEARSGHVGAGSFGEGTKIAASGIPVGAFVAAAITRAAFANDSGLASILSATAQAGAAGTLTLNSGASALDNFYQYQLVYIVGGTGVGQARIISSYVGSTKVATITPNWVTTPDATSVFTIVPSGVISTSAPPTALELADQVWDEARSGHVTAGTFGEGVSVNATERNAIADAHLNRDMSAVTVTNTRSPINALRFNRNKFTVVGTTLTVYKEDDTTVAWTATLSGINAFDVDPNG